ncbi:MAG: hypothetical protein V4440_04450 [Pseudomonadota bacterium]
MSKLSTEPVARSAWLEPTNFAKANNKLYIMNGRDPLKYIDLAKNELHTYKKDQTTTVRSYWKYDNFWQRIKRSKTFYHEVLEENMLMAYKQKKDGTIIVVKMEQL